MISTLLLLLSIPLHAEFTPLPASTPESTNSNFKTIDEEIRRLDSVISSTYGALGVLNGTNAWTGTNNINSGEWMAKSASSFTFQADSVNVWVRIASGNWVHQTTVTFSGMISSATYKLEFNIWNSTDQSTPAMVFNNDGTSESYQYNSVTGNQGVAIDYAMPGFSIPLTSQYAGYRNVVNSAIIGEATITTAFMSPQTVLVRINSVSEQWYTAGNYASVHQVAGRWTQATTPANLSSVQIICSSANMHDAAADRLCPIHGHFELWKKKDDFPVNSP